MAAASAATTPAALSPPKVDVPGGWSSFMHSSSKSSENGSSQIRVFNPSAQALPPNFNGVNFNPMSHFSPLDADDLFNKQLKKAADDFIPEHTVEDAEAPKSTPASPQPSVGSQTLRTTSMNSKESRERRYPDRDRDHDRAIDFSAVYTEDSVNADDNFTNPAWSKLVNRFNTLFPEGDDEEDEIPAAARLVPPPTPPAAAMPPPPPLAVVSAVSSISASVPVFNRPRMPIQETEEEKRTEEESADKPVIFNRPRTSNKDGASWIKKET